MQQLISICQSGQLSPEVELELRIEILAVIVQLMDLDNAHNNELYYNQITGQQLAPEIFQPDTV